MASQYRYRCEHCGATMPMNRTQYEALTDGYDRLLCPLCRLEVPKPPPKGRRYYPRDDGAIVTIQHEDGGTTVHHRNGFTDQALRDIVANIPKSSRVASISTPRTILRDLANTPRRRGNSRRLTDPYAVERSLLGRIGRLDLLPDGAQL